MPFGVAVALIAIFTLARLVQSTCSVGGVQPWRTASFGVGALAQLGVLGYPAYAVITDWGCAFGEWSGPACVRLS